MNKSGIGVRLVLALAASAALAGVAVDTLAADQGSQATRFVTHVDASGAWTEQQVSQVSARGGVSGAQPVGAGIIWHLVDAGSIVESVAVSDTTDESWVGHCLNSERLSYLQTTGTGTPIYDFPVSSENPSRVAVAAAEDASLGVALVSSPSGVTVRGFDENSGPTELWTYTFPANYSFVFIRDIDVSADGSIVAAVSNDSPASSSLLVLLDGVTGGLLNSIVVSGLVQAVELTDDGSRAVITQAATAIVVETTGLSTLHSFAVSGGGGYHRISRDGTVAAAGGFNLRAFRETGGVWTQVWTQTQANNFFGGVALSGDGRTLFAASVNFVTGYLDLTYRVVDLVGNAQIASTTTSGTGLLQDTVQQAQSSADGQTFAVASWGTADNVHPEVQVFDRDLNLIGGIDFPGSPFTVDLSRDGQFVLAGGKAIHANDFGSGSDTYAYRVFAVCPWDCGDGDGSVDTVDFLELLAQWGQVGTSCDFDGAGVSTTDFLTLLANWGSCP